MIQFAQSFENAADTLEIERIPKAGHAEKFRVKAGKTMVFGFSDTLLSIWGRPSEGQLKEIILAFISKFGITSELKILTSYDVTGGINAYRESLR
jgi:hypothetical protein